MVMQLMQLKGFYIMGFGCWFAMIPHDFQGILDNIDRKTSCSDLATSLVWRLFLENARTRMLGCLILPPYWVWIFTLCLPLYQLDFFRELRWICSTEAMRQGGSRRQPSCFFFFAMLQLHASEGSWDEVMMNELPVVAVKTASVATRLGSAVASTWTSPTIACIPWALMRPCSAWISEGASWRMFWLRGAWHIVGWPHKNKSSVNFAQVFACCAKAKQSVSWVEAMPVCEGMRRWGCDHPWVSIEWPRSIIDDGWWMMGAGWWVMMDDWSLKCVNVNLISLLQTRKHGIACCDIVVEEAEKKHRSVEGVRCWKYSRERKLLVMDALLIAKKRAGNNPEKLGSCRGDIPKKSKKHAIKNVIRGK